LAGRVGKNHSTGKKKKIKLFLTRDELTRCHLSVASTYKDPSFEESERELVVEAAVARVEERRRHLAAPSLLLSLSQPPEAEMERPPKINWNSFLSLPSLLRRWGGRQKFPLAFRLLLLQRRRRRRRRRRFSGGEKMCPPPLSSRNVPGFIVLEGRNSIRIPLFLLAK